MTTATEQNLVTVTVNGIERQFPKGKNLLAALLDQDVYVPHYCWHPSLSVAGNCRLCLVEIVGQPRPNVSCNMTCTDGLKINTEGAMVEDCRKGMMEFLLVNHPLDCPICDRGGECMLQRYSMEYGTGTARTIDERRRFEKPQFDPLIDIERNRCIMCTRCTRFMDEVAGEHLLAVIGRGNRNYIGTFGNGPVSNVFSGNIIDLCPVGCLTSKPFRFTARAWELQQVTTTCTLCSAGCPTTAWMRDGKLMRMTPPARKYGSDFTVDEDTTDFICNEGRFGSYYVNSPDRLTHARTGRGADQKPADLEAALEDAARALREAASAGPDKVAVLAGSRATNEEYYLLSRMARQALGTHQIDWRLDAVSDAAAQALGTALGASDGDLEALERGAYAATLVINADLLHAAPVIGLKIKEAARLGRTKLATLGPRQAVWLDAQAEVSALCAPHEVANHVGRLANDPPSKLLKSLQPVGEILSGAESGLLVLGTDMNGGAGLTGILASAFALLEKLGPGWKFLPVCRGRNAKGAFAAGAQADRLPGGRLSLKPSREAAATLWGEVPDHKGATPSAPTILEAAAAGKIKTLLLHRCDELVHHPNRRLVEKALDKTPEVIAVDVYPSWITERASVVLPGALFHETEGSMTSADGTLQPLMIANNAPGDAQEDWRLLVSLLEKLGVEHPYTEADAVLRELLPAWGSDRIFKIRDLRLPCAGVESPQRPFSPFGRRSRPEFRVRHAERMSPGAGESEAAAPGDGLRLLWQPFVQGGDHLASRSSEFDSLRPEAALELNPADAEKRGLAEGDLVKIKGLDAGECRVLINAGLAGGTAYGGSNVLGLRLSGGEAPTIDPVKVKG